MAFIQVIEFRTSDYDQIRALEDEWERTTEGTRTSRRSIVTRDRNDPDRHLVFVFFDSYESAMENSNLPATGEFAAKAGALVDGAMSFIDLDVIDERE
jgi:hypothetical protein